MSTIARIAKNTVALAAGNMITKVLSLVFLVYVARKLGDIGFGRFSIAMALVGLISVLPNYVARPYIIRETARDRRGTGRILDQVTLTNIVLSLLTLTGLALVAPHVGYHQEAVTAILILGFALIFDSVTNSYHSALIGFERMELSALINVVNSLLTVSLGFIVLLFGMGLLPLIVAYAVAKATTLIFAHRVLWRIEVRTWIGFDPQLMWRMLSGAWPFFFTTVFVIIYQRLDTVMLSFFRGEQEVGYYNAAYKLMEAIGLLTASFVAAVYPVLSRLFVDAPDRLILVYQRAMRYLLAFVVPASAGVTIVARDLMPSLFGSTFVAGSTALIILVWGQSLDCLNPLLSQTLRAVDRERTVAWITGFGALANILFNLLLIPTFGLIGAAIATLLCFGLVLATQQRFLKRAIGEVSLVVPLVRTIIASAAMSAGLLLLSRYFLAEWSAGRRTVVVVLAGAVIYLPLAVLFGVFDQSDRKFFADFVRSRWAHKRAAT